jgi:hypothetical protein
MCLTNVRRADDRSTQHLHNAAKATFLMGLGPSSNLDLKLQALARATIAFGVWRRFGTVHVTNITAGCDWDSFDAENIRRIADNATELWKQGHFVRPSAS